MLNMAQTFRKSKIENLHQEIEFSLNHAKSSLESNRYSDNLITKHWIEGQVEAYENVLKRIEREFDLTAE
jgi:hypothetical protein